MIARGTGLRLIVISFLVIVIQQALLLSHQDWLTGIDLYLVWLLAVSSTSGLGPGVLLAVAGGLCMDATSYCFDWFHTVFYLLPVLAGHFLGGQLQGEYGMMAALISGALGLTKLVLMLIIGLTAGWLSSPLQVFQLNYLPLLLQVLAVFVGWKYVLGLLSRRRGHGFGY